MRVKNVMSKDPHFVHPGNSLKSTATAMRDYDCGYMPVGENDRLLGAITDRDIVIRAVAEGRDLDTTKAGDVMTHKIKYCYEDATLEEAAELMEKHRVRRLVVLNRSKRLVGVLSVSDIATRGRNKKLAGTIDEALCHRAAA